MTAATITRPAGAQTIEEAQAVFTRARTAEWPEDAQRKIGGTVLDLATALKRYHDLTNGIVPPWCPGITPGPEGFAAVLRIAADDAWEAAEHVTALLDEHYENGGE